MNVTDLKICKKCKKVSQEKPLNMEDFVKFSFYECETCKIKRIGNELSEGFMKGIRND